MAWTTCKYCGKRTNGYYATRDHQGNHPLETERDWARGRAARVEGEMAWYEKRLATLQACEETIANYPDLPAVVVDLLHAEIDTEEAKERLKVHLESRRSSLEAALLRLAKAEAALAGKES